MILKFQHNMRINADGNISVSAEQVVDSEREAEEAGNQFRLLLQAFIRGYGDEAPRE